MASYAEIASHGPEQTDEEKMPAPIPEIYHEDDSVHSLNSQGSINSHNSVPSYADQQKEVEENAKKAEEEASRTAKKANNSAQDLGKKAEKSAQDLSKKTDDKASELERDGKKAYNDVKSEAKKDYKHVKKQAGVEADRAKKSAKQAKEWTEDNKNNPVVVGNAVVVTAAAGLLGIGAYRKYVAGELTWKIAGTWAGVVGLFAVGDYYVSSWLFKNKYPPKN